VILLDTNVLSELTSPQPAPQVVDWLAENEPRLSLPAIALAQRMAVATRDVKDCRPTGVRLINPWDVR
jgi:predicted nucleic acid-binding protein